MRAASDECEKPFNRRRWIQAAIYCAILLWINLYICRNLFTTHTAFMNSMQGFWAAIARLANGSWYHATWWPYWDCGIPFEFTYAPMTPALIAIGSSVFHLPREIAMQDITAFAYALPAVALFLLAWVFTRAAGYSFLAGLFYSLTSITRVVAPDDERFSWSFLWDARRFYVMAGWDDTPHVLALVFVLLAILFLAQSICKRRMGYYVAAAVCIGLGGLTSTFGPVVTTMAAFCLLFVLRRDRVMENVLLVGAIGAYGYALCGRFFPPTLMRAIQTASHRGEPNWNMGTVTALAITVFGWVVLWHFLPRWTRDWRMQFFALFAYLVSCPPMISRFLDRNIVPQPGRYRFEMELALSLLIVFGARSWVDKLPRKIRWSLLFLYLAMAGEQIVHHRLYAKVVVQPVPYEKTIEYRASTWVAQNLPNVRVDMPGSIARWTDTFTDEPQFTGGSWSIAYNAEQQIGEEGVANGADAPDQDAKVGQAWLRAYGVGAVGVPGPKSPEYWKGIRNPQKFDGVLPLLWREDDTSIYRIPSRTTSLAHVVPESAIVRHVPRSRGEIGEIQRYDAALEDPALPLADFQWFGRNGIRIHTTASPGQVISVQVSYHPGWHVTVGSRHPKLRSDGLGLIWFNPECNGGCDVSLDYDGGWELRFFRWLSDLAVFGLIAGAGVWVVRGVRTRTRLIRSNHAPL